MLIGIRHKKGDNLGATLCLLQPQLSPEDDIYIIDTANGEGWATAKKYGTSRSTIFCEVGQYDKKTSLSFYRDMASKNGHGGVIHLNNVLFSTTFIQNMKKAVEISNFSTISPSVLPTTQTLNPNFKWYGNYTRNVKECNGYTKRCFYTNWGDLGEGFIENEKIVLL